LLSDLHKISLTSRITKFEIGYQDTNKP